MNKQRPAAALANNTHRGAQPSRLIPEEESPRGGPLGRLICRA